MLFDLDDFEETRVKRAYLMYECGIHRQYTEDWRAHLDECWHGECPACGSKCTNQHDMHMNHGGSNHPAWEVGLCSKQHMLMNHAAAFARALDGLQEMTNCHAAAHKGMHRADGYFPKGVPIECIAACWIERRDWLVSHRVAEERIAHPETAEGIAAVSA